MQNVFPRAAIITVMTTQVLIQMDMMKDVLKVTTMARIKPAAVVLEIISNLHKMEPAA